MSQKVLSPTRVVLAIMLTACLWGCSRSSDGGFDPRRNVLSANAKTVLDTGESFVLLSLDPRHIAPERNAATNTTEIFHEYAVLGKVDIKERSQRMEILQALHKGIADSSGNVAGCFSPRHGISATLGGEKVELVICFECLHLVVYAGDTNGLQTSATPQSVFNKALLRAGVPIAGK